MDPLTAGVVNFQQAALGTQIDFAVARKILDSQQASGAAAIELIQAADKSFTQASDSLTAAATGLGQQVDAYA